MPDVCRLFPLLVIIFACKITGKNYGLLTDSNHLMFVPVRSANNSLLCATDPPSAVLSVADLSVGIPAGVPEDVICGFGCTGYSGCKSFNYVQQQNAPSRCDLYLYSPRHCSTASKNRQCKYYAVGVQW